MSCSASIPFWSPHGRHHSLSYGYRPTEGGGLWWVAFRPFFIGFSLLERRSKRLVGDHDAGSSTSGSPTCRMQMLPKYVVRKMRVDVPVEDEAATAAGELYE
ncbi:hypothetical protein CERZMDRAFT_100306 [Cercospora zeae-maydis SCOH1-5]|uniref:Uncharacterized protein n=1 Tax=Cercospora zeae-maydis SCOH1-5 TaxID=717836 RepID=A0A6A6F6T6_9PEZI|nr:hypothetical protein CERZMDRAFT_100306 [Cercospora zeae-maydis SCOH1-5]